MNRRTEVVPRWSWMTIFALGVLAILMGLVFLTLRPTIVLLPEDERFTGISATQLQSDFPRLFVWIGMVFRSWGAFAIGLGILIAGIAKHSFQHGETWAWWTLALAATATVSLFALVNFAIGSDFRWAIVVLGIAFATALWGGRPPRA